MYIKIDCNNVKKKNLEIEIYLPLKDKFLPTFKIQGKLQSYYQEKHSCISPNH